MTTLAIPRPPELASSRHQARALLANLPEDLSGSAVAVDCQALLSTASSFVDELVKIILVELEAERLTFHDAPARTRQLAERSARNRGVANRIDFHTTDGS